MNSKLIDNLGYKRLMEHGIKPSVQRLAVINYLIIHRTHPTADSIFNDLSKLMPTLSRTTVYNTLKLLSEKAAILALTIDEKNCRYDAGIEPHSHFRCVACGDIKDLPVAPSKIKDNYLDNCIILDTELYLYGYCPKCTVDNNKYLGVENDN
ncbi:MAG: transcriptional repressor [Bacteroidales bacterium]